MMDLRAYYGGKNPETMQEWMVRILGALRAQSWIFQTAHWQVKGTGYYGDHLLFERLYDAVQEEIDVIAEKLVGYFGGEAVDALVVLDETQGYVHSWAATDDPYQRCLKAENEFQQLLKLAYNVIQESADMPLGLDDWIMATASTHEAHVMLLQQRVRTASVESGPAAPSAEDMFFDNPEKREVRELAETEAVSNDPDVAEQSKEQKGKPPAVVRHEVQKAKAAPPTPSDIKEEPGGDEFSTLNRFVVVTEEPVPGVPEGHDEVPKHDDSLSKQGSDDVVRSYWRL